MKKNKAKLVAVRYIGNPIGNCMGVCLVGKGAPPRIDIQHGCYGLIDVANLTSNSFADYWYGYWLVNDEEGKTWGGYKSVMATEVMPICPQWIKPHEMRLLRRVHKAANTPC